MQKVLRKKQKAVTGKDLTASKEAPAAQGAKSPEPKVIRYSRRTRKTGKKVLFKVKFY